MTLMNVSVGCTSLGRVMSHELRVMSGAHNSQLTTYDLFPSLSAPTRLNT